MAVFNVIGAEFLALLSAMGWGSSAILVRKGGRFASVSLAVLLGFCLSTLFLWSVIWAFFPFRLLYSPATGYFFISGLIQPAIVRFLHYTGIVRLGASRAGPVRAITPLFAITIAFLFLGERPAGFVYLGAVLSVGGVWIISNRREGEENWRTIDLLFPLGAALLTAISQNFRKTGLLLLPNPFIAAAVTQTTSLVVFLSSLIVTRRAPWAQADRRCLPFYLTAALISTISQIVAFFALSKGDVAVVVSLISTDPLFTVIFSAIFLKDLERVTFLVVLGAILIVCGITLITYR